MFFKLSTPTAQRLYRFLDKRFYSTPELSLDLIELACGHVGLTEVDNVAILKRRLGPAIAELEKIGFLQPAAQAGSGIRRSRRGSGGCASGPPLGPPSPHQGRGGGGGEGAQVPCALTRSPSHPDPHSPAGEKGRASAAPPPSWPSPSIACGRRERRRSPACATLNKPGWCWPTTPGWSAVLLAPLVQVTRKEWPDCRSFSGAVQKYLGAAVKLHRQQEVRAAARAEVQRQRQQARQEQAGQQHAGQTLQQTWDALSPCNRTRSPRRCVAASATPCRPRSYGGCVWTS